MCYSTKHILSLNNSDGDTPHCYLLLTTSHKISNLKDYKGTNFAHGSHNKENNAWEFIRNLRHISGGDEGQRAGHKDTTTHMT